MNTADKAQVVTTIDAARNTVVQLVRKLQDAGIEEPSIGLVPTMGALHEGHGALLQQAKDENDAVVVSIFVNPLQFNEPEDYENYPRTLDADVEFVSGLGASIVFAPSTEHMYPGYPDARFIRVDSGEMGASFEGASRPGHFDGVATVVTKLWNILLPPSPAQFRSYFGQKDAQQLAVLRKTADDLNIPVEIRAVDLVRAPSGLALSSRNMRLDDEGKTRALALSKALNLLREQAEAGEVLDVAAARTIINKDPGVELDYLEVVEAETLKPLGEEELSQPLQREALALVAAVVEPVRLIDNMVLPAAR